MRTDAPVTVAKLGERGFVTAFPEGADKRELAAPVIVMHLSPDSLDLPPGARRGRLRASSPIPRSAPTRAAP